MHKLNPGMKHVRTEDLTTLLMVAEAGHYKTFLSLAKHYMDPVVVEARWREILAAEAEIVKYLEVRGDRMH